MVWGDVLRDDLRKPASWFEGMQAMGRPLGIRFDFEGEVGNSLDSLRLLIWSDEHSKQEELAGELARGHFEERRSVADHEVLLAACEAVGLPMDQASKVLESDAFADQVWGLYSSVQQQGVHSIPVFIFDDRWTMHGSKSVDEFVQLIREIEHTYA